nr:hypothetical protein [Tanacetum cinerariifolium]
MSSNVNNWSSVVYQEVQNTLKDEITPIVKQVDARVLNFEKHFFKEADKFVRDFKSLAKEADESLDILSISFNTQCESDTLDSLSHKLDDENVSLEFQEVDNTAKTRRPHLRRNTKNDRVLSASKSSCIKNKEVEVEEHHRNLLLSKSQKHMSSKCNNIKLAIHNDKSIVVCVVQICLWCVDSSCSKHMIENLKLLINFVWKFMGTVRFRNDHIAAILGYGDLQWGNILIARDKEDHGEDECKFDELSEMAFEQLSLKPRLQGMTYVRISSGLDLTNAPLKITSQKPTEHELDLLFEAIYDDYIGGQPSAAPRTAHATLAPQVLQTPIASTTTVDTTPTLTNSSTHAADFPNTSHDVDKLQQPKHSQQQDDQTPLQSKIVVENGNNAMFDENLFVNTFALPSTSSVESSSQYVDPSNMHTFYQPYQHDYQWTKDHPLEQLIGEPSRLVLTRNQLQRDDEMCIYSLSAQPSKNHLEEVKRVFRYLQGTINIGLWYTKDSGFELTGFSDADHARCQDSFENTFGETQFLDEKLVPVYCDSKLTIAISCNPVQHSRTKYIAVRSHFIKDHIEKGTIEQYFVKTDYQLADIFNKALPVYMFNYLVRHLGLVDGVTTTFQLSHSQGRMLILKGQAYIQQNQLRLEDSSGFQRYTSASSDKQELPQRTSRLVDGVTTTFQLSHSQGRMLILKGQAYIQQNQLRLEDSSGFQRYTSASSDKQELPQRTSST